MSAPAGPGDPGHGSPAPRRRGWGSLVAGGLCLLALGGYGLFLLSDRPDPVPAYPAASFGLSVAGATDPAAFQAVGESSLTVEDLDGPDASVEWETTFRGGDDPSRPVAGTVLVALPVEAELDSVRTLTLPAGQEKVIGADQVVVDALLDRARLREVPDQAAPVGTLNGRPLTALADGAVPPGAPPARLLQIPVAAEDGTVTLELVITAPSRLFADAGRTGETVFAVDFGATDAALRAAPDARPLAEYASASQPATLVLTLAYRLELTEMEVTSVPPVTRTAYQEVIWAEEVTEDGRLRVDGTLVDVPARYWLGMLDNAALLLLGALVAIVIDRLLTR